MIHFTNGKAGYDGARTGRPIDPMDRFPQYLFCTNG